jgi:hypothetical protein
LLGKWLVWNIGRGRKLKFRKDPWMGCKWILIFFESIDNISKIWRNSDATPLPFRVLRPPGLWIIPNVDSDRLFRLPFEPKSVLHGPLFPSVCRSCDTHTSLFACYGALQFTSASSSSVAPSIICPWALPLC